ncbi:hypothetical protein ZIOFF_059602 [Zingiber officinale]|uniref:Uncharacterized protein n=1 Tax=Zingiber officinale TaxID=94328 RepID=A0A8J5F9M8_ZINOF|nr:hypothetical protein ZIOFF_059602 [Zingiber officinale]
MHSLPLLQTYATPSHRRCSPRLLLQTISDDLTSPYFYSKASPSTLKAEIGEPAVDFCLDETHIKNKYKGCILVVVSKDANDNLFTIGYSVVDAENDANWE